MIRLFEEQVQKHGEKAAICDSVSSQTVTYVKLEENARHIAGKLISEGFGKGDAAMVTASRGIGFIESMLGVLMAGGIYVPLSDHYPAERLAYIRQDCGAKLTIDDAYIETALKHSAIAVPVETTPEDIALIAYTSGSTGNPKGVIHDCRSITEGALRYADLLALEDGDVYGINGPFYFILAVCDIFAGLISGTTQVIIPESLRGDPAGLAEFIDAQGITVTVIMPKVLRYFTRKGDCLRLVMTCGERLSQISPSGFRLLNYYGMTEACGLLSFFVDKPYDNTPIGMPNGGLQVYLLDENGVPGDEGEICVSGPLGRGYLHLVEQSIQTFTPNPFKAQDGYDTLLHTGDLGRRLPDGNIVYLNRKDWMVKINGQRVEPGEIEAEMRRIEGIFDAIVKDFIDASGLTFLAAYYLSDEEKSETKLKQALSRTLPEYMIPVSFTRLEKFPVNANGKLDRRMLPKPDLGRRRAAYTAPENEKQAWVAEAFETVLNVHGIGIDDDFFSLGGDSIKVMMLQKALGEKGIQVSSRTVFEAHTPRLLAAASIEESSLAEFRGTEAAAYPLTNAQMTVYLDCQTGSKKTAYNNVLGLFLPSDMNTDAGKLKAAAEGVLNSYPVLRSRIQVTDGMPSMVPSDERIIVALQSTDISDRKALAQRLNTSFDLEEELPCRASVFITPEGLFFVLVGHHIVCDGTTFSLLVQSIASAYCDEAIPREGMNSLTLSQYEAEHTEEQAADAEVYRKMLDLMEGDTELYADDDSALKAFAGKLGVYETTLFEHQGALSGNLIASLSEHHITESTLFMSAYAYMLRLLCNQKGVLFFVGENGRHDPILQNTIGMLVHNVPVFLNVDDSGNCAAFMDSTQRLFHELVTHDGADFAGLCGEYGIHPDCFFVYQGEMLSGVELDGRYIPMEFYKADDVMASLTLHVLKQKSGDYTLRFEYAAEKFSEDTVARMARIYGQIVAGLCGGGCLQDIRLADDAAIAEMDAFNATERDYPTSGVVEQFKAQAIRSADKPAVIFRDETLTYAQVDDISDRIAGKLRALGIGRRDVVSILIPRCAYMATASLGVLKSGAAYQPLDSTYPSERLTFMMADAGCKLLIADDTLLAKVPEYKGSVLLLKDIQSLPACPKIESDPKPEDLFILLYTSGSTGVPKGVMLEHHNITNFCAWYREYYHLDETCRVAAYASYGFDACMMDMYPALTTGACLCIVEEEIRLDLLAMEKWFDRLGITHAFMTTQVCRQFYTMTNPLTLRQLTTGGEKLVPVPPKADGPRLINGYGPTECTIYSTAMPVDRLYNRIPIGKPLSNYKCYVVDKNLRRLPPLVPGELLIAGYGVGRGYLNRPELTEKVFIHNPFCEKTGFDRAYRSGDIVRLLPNGEIDFIGRNDGQVKVRGFRIELTEVEAVIRAFPGVTDATVQAFEDEASGEKFIAAYVVAPETVNIPALNAFILERKPPYIVPTVTMQIDSIPLNQNQKVNKKALPRPQRQTTENIPPQNETQQRIFDCVAEVVGHAEFGVTTNIYEAGLSSIGAIRLNVLLSKEFNVPVRSADLKENNTVEKLEGFLSAAETGSFEHYSEYGITKTQEGIFVEAIANPHSTVYNIPILLEISPEIDDEKLKQAIVDTVNAHPYIMTTFFMNEDGEVRQRRTEEAFDISMIGIIKADSLESIVGSLVTPFDLFEDRMFRIKLINAGEKYLFLEMHHIISDGTSIRILLEDISRAYLGEKLETETFSGYEAALEEERLRAGQQFIKAKEYYSALLKDTQPESLPMGDVESEQAEKPAVLTLVSKRLTQKDIESFCDNGKCSENAFFTGVFGYVLSAYTRLHAPVFAGIYNGRSDSRLARTVSMLVKTFPIVCRTNHKEMRPMEYISEMGRQLLDSMANDLYSFEEISHDYSVSADVLFSYQGKEFAFDSLCGKPAVLKEIRLDQVKAPMDVTVVLKNGKICWMMEYNIGKYSEKYTKGFLEALDAAAKEFMDKARLKDIEIPDALIKDRTEVPGKRRNSMDDPRRIINETCFDEPFVPVTERFKRQVALHPGKTAVICRDEKLTYKKLYDEANRLAYAINERGIGREDIVAVMLPRSIQVYACRLGILNAGAAFLCIAPDYPDDRVEFILKDSGAKLLITDQGTSETRKAFLKALECSVVTPEELAEKGLPQESRAVIYQNDLCYCIYTSGSTGKPKGVMIEHGNLANFVSANPKNAETLGYTERARVSLSLAAMTFDVSIMENFIPLTNGMTAVIATEEEIHDLKALARLMTLKRVDMITTTPSFVSAMLEVDEMRIALANVASYDIGAEAFLPGLFDGIKSVNPNAYIMNGYGPTEATISCTMKVIEGEGDITIGKPNANVFIYIIDENGKELPAGEIGELLICGKGVGRGYINLPEKTAEAFITFNGMRGYRSGDLARINEAGEIEFHGRKDNQVKLRGFRVELGEIEEVLCSHPDVQLAACQAIDNKYLVAYYTALRPLPAEELRLYAAGKLTDYMVPGILMQMDSLPLTENKKIDRKSLPMPDLSSLQSTYAAPENEMQEKLCRIFAKVLKVDKVGIDDDFFEMGGTSLAASRVAVMCMNQKIPVVYADIFKEHSVRKLSAAMAVTEEEPADRNQFADYDYQAIRHLLENSDLSSVNRVYSEGIGDVLLTGATGFLGIHILREFLEHHNGKIYCLIRKGKFASPEARLKGIYHYYFSDTGEKYFGERLFCIDGDITDKPVVDALDRIPFNTLINCAACVKHFVSGDILQKINVEGVMNLISLCTKGKKRLIQISTVSVGGEMDIKTALSVPKIREKDLYFGQTLENEYIRTKFLAERAVLEAACEGCNAKVIRVGNLMSRDADGEFQINFLSNAFIRMLRGYKAVEAFPAEMLRREVEFSPIDATAAAVLKLAGTGRDFHMFHAVNNHRITMGDVIYAMRDYGYSIRIVSGKKFEDIVNAYLAKHEGSQAVSGLIAYANRSRNEKMEVDYENDFTTEVLFSLGYKWPITSDQYLRLSIAALDGLNFFEEE